MIRPKVFPGEIDRSYLGAVMRLNGLNHEDATIALMAQWAEVLNWTPRTTPVVELLSLVAGVPTQLFVQQHSTLAFRRAITSRLPDVPHGSLDNRGLLSNSGMRRTRTVAYFCIDCILADQSELIRSFWRREHQMPGLYWCSKHRIGLNSTDAENAFSRSPSEFVESSCPVDDEWAAGVRSSKPVLRFLDICSALMETRAPFTVPSVRDALRLRAHPAGIRCSGRGQTSRRERYKELVSDRIQSLFPSSWLEKEFPAFGGRRAGQMLQSIDGVLWSGKAASTVASYALVASVLFETGDDAVAAFMTPPTHRSSRPVPRVPHKLRQIYVESLGSYDAISRKVGAVSPSVLRTLADLGLPNLGSDPADQLLMAARMFYVQGYSIGESASIAGVSHATLEALVRQAGTGFRTALLEFEGCLSPCNAIEKLTRSVRAH